MLRDLEDDTPVVIVGPDHSYIYAAALVVHVVREGNGSGDPASEAEADTRVLYLGW